jgi:hypothetical protein
VSLSQSHAECVDMLPQEIVNGCIKNCSLLYPFGTGMKLMYLRVWGGRDSDETTYVYPDPESLVQHSI